MQFKKVLYLPLLLFIVASCGGGGQSVLPSSESTSSEPEPLTTSQIVTSEDPTSEEIPGETIQDTFHNPVHVVNSNNQPYAGEVADPSIVRDGADFYIYATNDVILRSEDACHWKYYGRTGAKWQWARDTYPDTGYALWAPDCIKINDYWYYYYSISNMSGGNPGIGYMVGESPVGPWLEERKLFFGTELSPVVRNCIDPHIFVDDDGCIYVTVGSFQGIYIIELEEDDGVLDVVGAPTLIAGRGTNNWEASQFEGSYIIKKGEYYYYFGSHGTCCKSQGKDPTELTYQVAVGRSKNILGPYVDKNANRLLDSNGGVYTGTLCLTGDASREIYAPGHNSIFLDDAGDYWIYYHAYVPSDNLFTRHLMMDKLEWDNKGFPYIDGAGKCLSSYGEDLEGPVIFNPDEI